MNVTRMAILGVALVAGAGAFFLILSNRPVPEAVQIVEPLREKSVRVLVADRAFTRGERFDVESVRWAEWPEKSVSEFLLTEAAGVTPDSLAGAVARTSFVAGEPIIEEKIVRAGSAGLMAAILAPGMRAVTQRVSPESASGGFILPGDRVDVLLTSNPGGEDVRTRTIFEDVKVLAVNTIYTETPEAPVIEGVNMTLEFSPSDSESFITARSSGAVSLVLRSVFVPEGDVASQTKRSADVTVIRYGRS